MTNKNRPAKLWKRAVFGCLVAVFPVCLFLAYQLGHFTKGKSWKEAAGWNSISPAGEFYNEAANPSWPKIHWLGHAGFLIEIEGKRLLLDPVLNPNCTIAKRVISADVLPESLPAADAVLLSHAHYDHLDNYTLERVSEIRHVIAPFGTHDFVSPQVKGRSEAVGLRIGEKFKLDGVEVIAVPAVHNGARNHPFSSTYFALGYIIRTKGMVLYFSGDTGWGEHFKEIRTKYSPDIAILPIGGFRPYFVLQNYHLSPEDAVRASMELGVKLTIPCHFGTYRVAFDYPETALPRFAEECLRRGVKWRMPKMLAPGEH